MDPTHLEYAAEELISYKLHKAGFLVAKPKPDKKGTDLLVFREMDDGVKFCRVQCKGRTITRSDSSIEIPVDYVKGAFIVFLYLEVDDVNNLYCFIESDIRAWSVNSKNRYRLKLSKNTYATNLANYQFDESKVRLIRNIIEAAEVNGEFRRMVYGSFKATTGAMTMSAQGSS